MPTLQAINALSPEAAFAGFQRCCGATRWAEGMVGRRPFTDEEALYGAAEAVADTLTDDDWREAFSHHPRIGGVDSLRQKFATTRGWSEGEQAGVAAADEAMLQALAERNAAYEARFGFIFIVCATGKTAAEMLGLLRERLPNDPAKEIHVAAAEQRKITRIRLGKWLAA